MKLTDYEKELIDSTFDTFENKSTEFILQVATNGVSDSLGIKHDDALDLIMDYLYEQSKAKQ